MKTKLLATAALLLSTTFASADIISVTVTGTVAPYTWNGSAYTSTPLIDNGTFGSSQSLFGAPFTEAWTVNTSLCNSRCDYVVGGTFQSAPSPILSAMLTINDTTIDYGGGGYGVMYNYHNESRAVGISTNNGYFDAFYINITVTPGNRALNAFIDSFGGSFPGNINVPWSYTINPTTDNLDNPNGLSGAFSYNGVAGYLNATNITVENLTNPNYTAPAVVQTIAPPVAVPFPAVGAGLPSLLLLAWVLRRCI